MHTVQRRLGTAGAAAIGVASMLGAGVFFVWAPAAAAAGGAVLLALPIAAGIASLNAVSTIRLAMRHPVSGGAYAYGRAELGPTAGFVAGALFLVGKTASVAAIGLIAGGYLWPGAERVVAVVLVVALAALNATGVRTTAAVSAVAASVVIAALLAVLAAAVVAPRADAPPVGVDWPPPGLDSGVGLLSASAVIFFAFAGYARIATLGEEVRDPIRTLPRAALLSITAVLLLSSATLAVLVALLGTDRLAASGSPLVQIAGGGWRPVVRGAAALACIGSLTGVLAGLSRTAMAMSRDRELPGALAYIASRTTTPVVADVVVAATAVLVVLLVDPARTVGVSACAVLGYYAIAHLAALRAGPAIGLPRVIPALGLGGCLLISVSTPWPGVLAVVILVGAAVGLRALARRTRPA